MSVSKEFIDSFEMLVKTYGGMNKRWMRDTHYELIYGTLSALFDIIVAPQDEFTDKSLINFLSISAVILIYSDPDFTHSTHIFLQEYSKRYTTAPFATIDKSVYAPPSPEDEPPTLDLIRDLQKAISSAQKAHDSEVSVFSRQLESVGRENTSLRKQNELLRKQNASLQILKTQLDRLERAASLIKELNSLVDTPVNIEEELIPSLSHMPSVELKELPPPAPSPLQITPNIELPPPSFSNASLSVAPLPQPKPEPVIKAANINPKEAFKSVGFFDELASAVQKRSEKRALAGMQAPVEPEKKNTLTQ